MPGAKGKSGGSRPVARPDDGRLTRKPESEKVKHIQIRIAQPEDRHEEFAVKWWKSLSPRDRTEIIFAAFRDGHGEGEGDISIHDSYLDYLIQIGNLEIDE